MGFSCHFNVYHSQFSVIRCCNHIWLQLCYRYQNFFTLKQTGPFKLLFLKYAGRFYCAVPGGHQRKKNTSIKHKYHVLIYKSRKKQISTKTKSVCISALGSNAFSYVTQTHTSGQFATFSPSQHYCCTCNPTSKASPSQKFIKLSLSVLPSSICNLQFCSDHFIN